MAGKVLRIEVCTNSSEEWLTSYILPVLVSSAVISAIVQLLHTLVLATITDLRKQRYFWILFKLNFAELLSAVVFLIGAANELYRLQHPYGKEAETVIIAMAIRITFSSRYYQLTLASLDRFYAVCKPFDYADSRLINNIGKMSILAWVFNTTFYIFYFIVAAEDSCLEEFTHVVIHETSNKHYLDGLAALTLLFPSLVTAVMLTKVGIELKRMSKRRNMTNDDREVRQTAKYIIGTCIMFYSTVLPLILYVVLTLADAESSLVRASLVLVIILQIVYGIGNVVLYAYLNPSYIQKIMNIVSFLNCNRKVSPN